MKSCACIFCIQSIMCRHIAYLYKATSSSTTGLEWKIQGFSHFHRSVNEVCVENAGVCRQNLPQNLSFLVHCCHANMPTICTAVGHQNQDWNHLNTFATNKTNVVLFLWRRLVKRLFMEAEGLSWCLIITLNVQKCSHLKEKTYIIMMAWRGERSVIYFDIINDQLHIKSPLNRVFLCNIYYLTLRVIFSTVSGY